MTTCAATMPRTTPYLLSLMPSILGALTVRKSSPKCPRSPRRGPRVPDTAFLKGPLSQTPSLLRPLSKRRVALHDQSQGDLLLAIS